MRIYPAIILNDYPDAPYAEWIASGIKTIETRMRTFSHRGDLVICCGKSGSVGKNAGKALCIVDLWKIRPMNNTAAEVAAAGIGWDKNRKSFLLRNWRHFSRNFEFAPMAVKRNFQGLFSVMIPDDVTIIPMPGIKAFEEK